MPRLSEEQRRATASMATPSPARASGHFRDIFKPRRSTSEGSPKTLTNPPPAVMESGNVHQSGRESLRTGVEEHSGTAEGSAVDYSHVPATEPVVVHQLSTDFELGTEVEVESVGALSASAPVQGKSLGSLPDNECLQADITGDSLSASDARGRQKSFAATSSMTRIR